MLDQNKIKEAIAKYTTVVELSPTNKLAISNRAFAYLQLDEYQKALNDYNIALKLDEKDYRNLSNRALVKWYLKQYYVAIEDCNKAIKYNPNYAYAYLEGISEFEFINFSRQ